MKLLKEWEDVENMSLDIMQAFYRWSKANLKNVHPKSGTTAEKFGLPYTSSSDFAALWNCQGIALYKWKPEWSFLALAYSENMDMIAVFENEETEKHMYVIIG